MQAVNTRIDRRSRKGFTLVEIMVVVSIIGMLLAIVAPNWILARNKSEATSCQRNLIQIESAKERWAMDNNAPANSTPVMDELAVPGVYMRGTPECPAGGEYTVNDLNTMPTCSIGGTPGSIYAHVLP